MHRQRLVVWQDDPTLPPSLPTLRPGDCRTDRCVGVLCGGIGGTEAIGKTMTCPQLGELVLFETWTRAASRKTTEQEIEQEQIRLIDEILAKPGQSQRVVSECEFSRRLLQIRVDRRVREAS